MDAKNNKEKLNRLYSYLQQNMRYVSIQLGIGGWKPMNVQQVHDFKYGDCKALSNYMKHVLNVAGIPSKYVIINAGVAENHDDTTLVRNSFNHAILAAFPDNDTVFLECTSSKTAAGYLGSFTGNRHALMIDGENSKIIKTKEYSH
ncbi:MAG: transglutaminase domain-containing protein [Saprospiraceae bacterium]|nr:transglutaminase domain-containing protein [Saprospiraceae bacterium]